MFERILVPLDGSRFSGRALTYAIEIAKRFNSEVSLIEVVTPTTPEQVTSLSAEATQIAKEAAQSQDRRHIERAKRYLSKKLQEVTAHGARGSYHTVLGDPAKTIIGFCQKESVGLVIMTTSGKGRLKRAILGSVADEVVRESGIPVLAIRPKKRRTQK